MASEPAALVPLVTLRGPAATAPTVPVTTHRRAAAAARLARIAAAATAAWATQAQAVAQDRAAPSMLARATGLELVATAARPVMALPATYTVAVAAVHEAPRAAVVMDGKAS